jgi:hypothetical protein
VERKGPKTHNEICVVGLMWVGNLKQKVTVPSWKANLEHDTRNLN